MWAALLINSLGILSRLANVVPGGIGVREFLLAAMAHLTGLDFATTILVVGIDRLGEVLVNFALGAWMLRSGAWSRQTYRPDGS